MTGAYPEPPPQYGQQPQYGPPPPPQYGPPPPQYGPPQPPFGYPAPPPDPGGRKSNRGLVIALVCIVGALALACAGGIVGVVWWANRQDAAKDPGSQISGLIDYRKTHPEWLERDHRDPGEKIQYPMVPAAGGPHHPVWQRCAGDVYTTPVDEGNAVHSLEHGAVWITYRVGLAPGEVEKLAKRVRNNDYMLMSPYDGQPSAISLQAWGYQLRVDTADDGRIDKFIKAFRETATLEAGVPCSNGTISNDVSPEPTA